MSYENPMEGYIIKGNTQDSPKLKEYWSVGIGLNQVDNLKPSDYLLQLAKRHIEGEITSEDVDEQLKIYYNSQDLNKKDKQDEYECDMVSKRILDLLDNGGFTFAPQMLKNIHAYLFEGMEEYQPGQYKTEEWRKKEAILGGESVQYGMKDMVAENLEYDFTQERGTKYSYPMTTQEIIHLVKFVSSIWQGLNVVLPEGNTRTTAVFTELYLRNLGYDINNMYFEQNAVYFRDALVRANYTNVRYGVQATDQYIHEFFDNLINNAGHDLIHEQLICNDMIQ